MRTSRKKRHPDRADAARENTDHRRTRTHESTTIPHIGMAGRRRGVSFVGAVALIRTWPERGRVDAAASDRRFALSHRRNL